MDRAALVGGTDEARWSYRTLFERAAAWHSHLRSIGLDPGSRILVRASKSFENVALYLGALRAGVVYVPLHPECTEAEWGFYCQDARPSAVVVEQQSGLDSGSDSCSTLHLDNGVAVDALRIELGITPSLQSVTRSPEEPAAIIYTSGTTGRPKGALLPHRALSSNTQALCEAWNIQSSDVLIHALPIFHVHGLFVALNTMFQVGGTIRFLERFDTQVVRDLLPTSTLLMGVPTFYTRLLDASLRREEWERMRLVTCGSAPLTAELHRAFERVTGVKILERYGMTEAGMITSNPLEGERRAGSVGFALSGIEIRLRTESPKDEAVSEGGSGKAAAPARHEEVGELEVRGDNLCLGYLGRAEESAELFTEDGFLRTGDLASIDPTGRVTLVGRAKDLIISGGMNVYPKEIEDCIEAVEGVREVAVIGLPDAQWGEAVAAVIVFEPPRTAKALPTNDERLTEVKERVAEQLAGYKRPKQWMVADELPRNALGKIQKKQLRESYRA